MGHEWNGFWPLVLLGVLALPQRDEHRHYEDEDEGGEQVIHSGIVRDRYIPGT
jgi:hypothetical protein